eukprot:36555-Rhodomonas_salina.2
MLHLRNLRAFGANSGGRVERGADSGGRVERGADSGGRVERSASTRCTCRRQGSSTTPPLRTVTSRTTRTALTPNTPGARLRGVEGKGGKGRGGGGRVVCVRAHVGRSSLVSGEVTSRRRIGRFRRRYAMRGTESAYGSSMAVLRARMAVLRARMAVLGRERARCFPLSGGAPSSTGPLCSYAPDRRSPVLT